MLREVSPDTGATPLSMRATPTPLPVIPALHRLSAPMTRPISGRVAAEASKRQRAPCGPLAALPDAGGAGGPPPVEPDPVTAALAAVGAAKMPRAAVAVSNAR